MAAIIALAGWWSGRRPGCTCASARATATAVVQPAAADGPGRVGAGLAQRYVDDDTRANLDVAAGLLDMFRAADSNEPMTVEIDEEDGDYILVHIG